MAIIDDLLAENQVQLEKLLDLYLNSDFPKELLTERKNRLETTIRNLESEKIRLTAHIEARPLPKNQIKAIMDFAEKVKVGLTVANDNFETRRRIIEMLDLKTMLSVEEEQQVVYVQGRLGDERLTFASLALYEKFW